MDDEDHRRILLQEFFTASGLLSTVFNILLIFVILKFKKLRKEPTNIIIVHLNVLHCLFLLATPLTVRATFMLGPFSLTLFIVFFENECILMLGVSLFLLLLVCDWYLKTYQQAKYVKFTRVYKFFVAIIYVCVLCLCALVTVFYFKLIWGVGSLFPTLACYAILFIFLVVMNLVHLVKRRRLTENKHNVGLVLANIFFMPWIPVLVLYILLFLGVYPPAVFFIIFIVIGFSSPIFNFLYLFFCVETFNIFLKKVFKCQCNDYGNELLDDASVAYTEAAGVKIDTSEDHSVV